MYPCCKCAVRAYKYIVADFNAAPTDKGKMNIGIEIFTDSDFFIINKNWSFHCAKQSKIIIGKELFQQFVFPFPIIGAELIVFFTKAMRIFGFGAYFFCQSIINHSFFHLFVFHHKKTP